MKEKKEKLSFSGHETFTCRSNWLKKGYDFVKNGGVFNDAAVIELGVGRNMVNAIRFWLKSFGLTDENDLLLPQAAMIFDDEVGFDPYCEDKATVWLLHYMLVTTQRASIYSLAFNHFRKQRVEFTKDVMLMWLEQYCIKQNYTVQTTSLSRDIDVFFNTYRKKVTKSVEDNLSGVLQELNLILTVKNSILKIENKVRQDLPALIILYCIVRQLNGSTSISFQDLLHREHSVGSVFALSSNGLMQKIQELMALYPKQIVFTDDGGIRLLQFKEIFIETDILKSYYASQSIPVG